MNYFTIPGLDHPTVGKKRKLTVGTGDARIMEIIDVIAAYYQLTSEAIIFWRGPAYVVKARHMVFYFSRKLTGLGLQEIADIFGMNHSSVLLGAKSIKNQLSVKHENSYKTDVLNLDALL